MTRFQQFDDTQSMSHLHVLLFRVILDDQRKYFYKPFNRFVFRDKEKASKKKVGRSSTGSSSNGASRSTTLSPVSKPLNADYLMWNTWNVALKNVKFLLPLFWALPVSSGITDSGRFLCSADWHRFLSDACFMFNRSIRHAFFILKLL